jgi:HK97 family phage prohead protease
MKVEIRNDSVNISGYVNVASRDSRMLPSSKGTFIEQVEPRAFERALTRTDNVDLLFNHLATRKLGSTQEGNLKLHEDAIGLYAETTVTDPEVVKKAQDGELRGWSFGFIAKEDRWDDSTNPQRRYLKDLDLLEVSILSVTPAYTAMSLEARGEEMLVVEQRFESFDDVKIIEEKREEEFDQSAFRDLENYLTIKK